MARKPTHSSIIAVRGSRSDIGSMSFALDDSDMILPQEEKVEYGSFKHILDARSLIVMLILYFSARYYYRTSQNMASMWPFWFDLAREGDTDWNCVKIRKEDGR
jgi:hypothetical protein